MFIATQRPMHAVPLVMVGAATRFSDRAFDHLTACLKVAASTRIASPG